MSDAPWLEALAAIADGTDDDPDALECLGDLHETPGMLLHGSCHLMALALHETTGLPIGAVLGGYDGKAWLVHAFVADGDDAIDVKGRRGIDEMLQEFLDDGSFDASDVVLATVEEIVRLGEGRKRIRKSSLPLLAEARAAAPMIAAIASASHGSAPEGP